MADNTHYGHISGIEFFQIIICDLSITCEVKPFPWERGEVDDGILNKTTLQTWGPRKEETSANESQAGWNSEL